MEKGTTKSNTLKKQLIKALEKSLGVITTACVTVDIARSTFYEWYKGDIEFKKEVDSIGDMALDFAESKLFEKIEGVWVDTGKVDDEGQPIVYKQVPSDTALIFYLKTKGKKRGYIEKYEIDQTTTEIPATLDALEEARQKLIDEIAKDNPPE